LKEWAEEAGGKDGKASWLKDLRLWAVKLDHRSGHRFVTLSKATDGDCPRWLANVRVQAFFGVPDRLFAAMVQGEPAPCCGPTDDLAEAAECRWVDTRTLRISADKSESEFGAQHELVLKVWAYVLANDARLPLQPDTFDDFDALRERLLSMQSSETSTRSHG